MKVGSLKLGGLTCSLLLLWLQLDRSLVLSFRPFGTARRATSSSTTTRLYQSAFSSLNNTDWAEISKTRREKALLSQNEISRPVALPFFTGVKFIVASSLGQAHLYLNKLRDRHGDAFIIWNKYVTINDASAIRDVLETYNLPKPDLVLRGYRFFFGRGSILAAPWEEWKKQRRMSNDALAEASIGALAPRLIQGITPMLNLLELAATSGDVVEMDSLFQNSATDIIGMVIFGKSFGLGESLLLSYQNTGKTIENMAEEELNVFRAMDLLKTESQRQMVLSEWMLKLVGPSDEVLEAKQYMNEFLEERIEERLQLDNEERANIVDMMNVLVDSYEKGTVTREDVKGQLLTFLFGGQDTTAHTLTWMLYEISLNSTLQEELAEEIKEALTDRTASFANGSLLKSNKLAKLDRTFSETLRKYPAAATGTVRVVGDTPIVVGDSNLELPAGTSVTIPPYALHRNPKYWPDPERFDPDRFLPEMVKDRDPWTFQAFSGGPRNCVGNRLARIEALTTMSALLRRFRVKCVETNLPPKQFCALTMKPKNGIRFTFEQRE